MEATNPWKKNTHETQIEATNPWKEIHKDERGTWYQPAKEKEQRRSSEPRESRDFEAWTYGASLRETEKFQFFYEIWIFII